MRSNFSTAFIFNKSTPSSWCSINLVRCLLLMMGMGYSLISSALVVNYLPNYRIVDQDLLSRGNLALVNQFHVQYQYMDVMSNGKAYRLGKFNGSNAQPVRQFLVLHDNEDAAFDSGLQMIVEKGGTLWVLENDEYRNLFDMAEQKVTQSDPNRIFWGLNPATDRRINLPITSNQSETAIVKSNPDAEFANYLLEQLGITTMPTAQAHLQPPVLLALHNNRPQGTFGVDYIDNFGNAQVLCQNDTEQKNLYWFAIAGHKANDTENNRTSQPVAMRLSNRRSQQLAMQLCEQGQVNVVLESAPTVVDGDGSLSVYMVNHAPHWQYVNIEIKAAQKGDITDETQTKNTQIDYINTLERILTRP